MAKTPAKKTSKPKKRADKYDPKLKFDGSFSDLVDISIRDANKPKKDKKE